MEPISSARLARLQLDPYAPADYVQWIRENGWGDVASSRYMLYDGLIPLQEIINDAPPGFFSFGDDMAGCSGCFSKELDGVVYECAAADGIPLSTGKRFPQFIIAYV
jgi:hypothetical protein